MLFDLIVLITGIIITSVKAGKVGFTTFKIVFKEIAALNSVESLKFRVVLNDSKTTFHCHSFWEQESLEAEDKRKVSIISSLCYNLLLYQWLFINAREVQKNK